MEDLIIGAVCMHAEPGQMDKNLATMARLTHAAAAEGADIICFPELSLTGYTLEQGAGRENSLSLATAESILTPVAGDEGVIMLAGIAEDTGKGKPFITQLVVGSEGLLGVHRKTHLGPPEKGRYQAADSLGAFSVHGTTIGIQLCYETHFPEISTTMALQGAELFFCPHASPRGSGEEKRESWLRHLPARAFDNGVFLVACNQVGETSEGFSFPGVALVIGPDGRLDAVFTGDSEKVLIASVKSRDLLAVRQNRMGYFLRHRRPSLYDHGPLELGGNGTRNNQER
jgi:predicted amidohydrolase